MFIDNQDDWVPAPPSAPAQVLTVVSLLFGGLSVVALLGIGTAAETSWVLNDILAKWDWGLRLAFAPLGGLLELAVREVRALGLDASLRAMWPHVVVVSVLVGLGGIANARGWWVLAGALWLVVCLAIGFVALSGVGWTWFVSLEAMAGVNFGARLAVLALAAAAVIAVMVRILLEFWPEAVFEFFMKIERWLGPIRVMMCFAGAGLILTADSFGQMFL